MEFVGGSKWWSVVRMSSRALDMSCIDGLMVEECPTSR